MRFNNKNVILPAPWVPSVPDDEIWYTSSDRNIVTPYDSTALPTIVSNTYVDGKGIIKFATDVTNIGNNAFKNCSGLTSVTIPNSVTSIGSDAFYSCSSLTSVHIFDIAAWCAIGFSGSASNPLNYAHNLYLNETLVTNLVIPNSVTGIRNYAFYNCTSLTSITIPNSVTSIGTNVFYQCNALTSIEIPNSVTSIGNYAFAQISAKILFSKLYSTYTNKIFTAPTTATSITCNVEFNISEIPTGYNISSMLPQGPSQSNKGSITYNIYTDYAPCKDQALALANTKTIVNVYHIDGTPWE